MRKWFGVLVLAAILLGASACSSDGSDGGDATTTTADDGGSDETTTTAADDDETTTTEDGDASGPSDEDYQQAIQLNMTTGSREDGNLVIADGEAECVAPAWLDIITADHLRELEVTVEELSDPGYAYTELELDGEKGQALIDAFDGCGVDLYGELALSMTTGMTDEQQACAAENIDPELANALLLTAFSTANGDGSAEIGAVIDQLTEACQLPG